MTEDGRILVSPQVLIAQGQEIQQIAKKLDGTLDQLRAELQKLVWADTKSGEAYHTQQIRWDTAVVEMNRVLNEIGAKCGQAAQNYIDTDNSVARLWD